MRDGGWNSDIKAVWVRLEGHGWDGKATKMKIQGRVVGMEDSGRKKGSNLGTEQKRKKHNEITDFSRNRLSFYRFQRKSVQIV